MSSRFQRPRAVDPVRRGQDLHLSFAPVWCRVVGYRAVGRRPLGVCGGCADRGRSSGAARTPQPVAIRTAQPDSCSTRWCRPHNITRLLISVGPPCCHSTTWCTSAHEGGRSQPGKAQPRSRAATARRKPSGMVRVARPTSSGCPALPRTTGTTAASQHNRRSAAGVNAPPRSSTASRARCSRSSRVTVTVNVGRCPPVCGKSPWVSTYPHISPRASARRCAVDRGSSLLRGAVLASISVVIAPHSAASPNRPVIVPPPSRAGVRNSSLTGSGSSRGSGPS